MAKIPKNLSDKDMFQNYKEEETLESVFLSAEAADDRKRREVRRPAEDLSIAYLTPDIIEKLGKLLLELKMDLYKDGIKEYKIRVKRDKSRIILEPELREAAQK